MELIGTVHNNSIVFDKLNLPEGKKVRVIIKDEEETKKQKLFNFIKKNKTDYLYLSTQKYTIFQLKSIPL